MKVRITEERTIHENGGVPKEVGVRRYRVDNLASSGALAPSVTLALVGDEIQVGHEPTGWTYLRLDELTEAVTVLRRLGAIQAKLGQDYTITTHRAAAVVERACAELESGDDPARVSLATDLRATMLQLIDLATNG